MTQYRKVGMRTFYMVKDDGIVVKILNKELLSQISVCKNRLIEAEAFDETEAISEAEFKAEYDVASKRVLTQVL